MENALGPRLTPAQRFGRELARVRKNAGLSQVALGKHLDCSSSLVAHIEIAARNPSVDFARRCDAFFGTDDRFARLQRHVATPGAGPGWYVRWSTEIEPRARSLRSWDPLLVPGLLQTEDYSRALFAGGLAKTADEIQAKVSARMRPRRSSSATTLPHSGRLLRKACCTAASADRRSCSDNSSISRP